MSTDANSGGVRSGALNIGRSWQMCMVRHAAHRTEMLRHNLSILRCECCTRDAVKVEEALVLHSRASLILVLQVGLSLSGSWTG